MINMEYKVMMMMMMMMMMIDEKIRVLVILHIWNLITPINFSGNRKLH